tara:strand:+ start:122 stop:478 length:357 start_codon:yes stop_codon:yes gene_type:complete
MKPLKNEAFMTNKEAYNGYTNYETWKVTMEQVHNDYDKYHLFQNFVRLLQKGQLTEEKKILALGGLMKGIILQDCEQCNATKHEKLETIHNLNYLNVDWVSIAKDFHNYEVTENPQWQ